MKVIEIKSNKVFLIVMYTPIFQVWQKDQKVRNIQSSREFAGIDCNKDQIEFQRSQLDGNYNLAFIELDSGIKFDVIVVKLLIY